MSSLLFSGAAIPCDTVLTYGCYFPAGVSYSHPVCSYPIVWTELIATIQTMFPDVRDPRRAKPDGTALPDLYTLVCRVSWFQYTLAW